MKILLKKLLVATLIFAATSAFCLTLYYGDNKYNHDGPQAIAGTLLVSETDWTDFPVRYLWNGWNFYPDVILTPDTYAQRTQENAIPVRIGEYNNLAFGNPKHSPHGCGTYNLTLILPDTPHTYAIELPEVFSAYRFYVGDQLMLEMGDPDKDSYQVSIQNRVVTFEASGPVRLLLAVRDESHIYSGLVYPPSFGEPLYVNTVRAVRVCLSVSTVTATLLFALLSLWIAVHTHRRRKNAKTFFLLCLNIAVFLSYSMVHAIFPMDGHLLWYTLELVSGYLVTMLILLLHNRICHTTRSVKIASIAFALLACMLSLLYGFCARHLSQFTVAAFSNMEFGWKLMVTLYLLLTALVAIKRQEGRAEPLFYADIFYGVFFLWDCLLPDYEPIMGGWFQEWGCLVLMVVLGVVLWRDVAQGYYRSLTFAEEQRQMQRQLEIQQVHYRQIAQQVEESRRQRHDFRQQLRTIASLSGEPKAQLDYINQITAVSVPTHPVSYCHDSAANALIYYYVFTAEKQGIAISVQVELPEEIRLNGVSFCTILGNLLENAVEACQRQSEENKFIHLHIKWQFSKIYLVLENSYDGLVQNRHNVFFSRKHEGRGIGIMSVRELTNSLDGTVEFHPRDKVFQVVLVLPPQK